MQHKKFLALFLSVCLIAGAGFSAFAADLSGNTFGTATCVELINETYTLVDVPVTAKMAAEPVYEEVNGTPRLIWPMTFEDVYVTVTQTSGVWVDITLNLVENTSNDSGFEIVGVQTPVYVAELGFYDVLESNITVTDWTYANGNQTVYLTIQFQTKATKATDPWVYNQGFVRIDLPGS